MDRDRIIAERQARIDEIVARYEQAAEENPAMLEDQTAADEFYMMAALDLASLAEEYDDVPVGCVIVRDGHIIAAECNGREVFRDATYHAETAAISKAGRLLGGWRLTRSTLYVTLEPCPMCGGAIWCARVPRVVIGARDLRAGVYGTLLDLNEYPLNHKPELTFGVREEESKVMLQSFFQKKRRENRE